MPNYTIEIKTRTQAILLAEALSDMAGRLQAFAPDPILQTWLQIRSVELKRIADNEFPLK